MPTVTGAFKAGVPKVRQRELLEALGRRAGVTEANFIKEDAASDDMRLLFYVRADEDAAKAVVEELRSHADVAAAELAARRRLT